MTFQIMFVPLIQRFLGGQSEFSNIPKFKKFENFSFYFFLQPNGTLIFYKKFEISELLAIFFGSRFGPNL